MRIKNIFTLIIFTITFILNELKAQDSMRISNNEILYEFGLRISPQISWVSPDSKSIADGGASLDWNFGFHIAKKFTNRYAIAMEVNVINMTSKIKLSDIVNVERNSITTPTNDMALNYYLRYLEVPFLFKMNSAPINDRLGFYGEFGLGLGALIRSKVDVNSSALKLENVDVDNPDTEDYFKIIDKTTNGEKDIKIGFLRPSFIVGGGITYILFGETKAYAGLRYDGGLIDYLNDEKWEARNSFTAFNFGIIF